MNRFTDFYKNMNAEEWEKFSVHVLVHNGFKILTLPAYGPDGGKDYLAEQNNIIYLVSCKHYITSGKHVGIKEENSILDRLMQHNAKGFIGFYSTEITQSLYDKFLAFFTNNNIPFLFFTPEIITASVQGMDSRILQSFGLYPNKYYTNVSQEHYLPLPCMHCGKDILTDENIPFSYAGLIKNNKQEADFIFGCKNCFSSNLLPWIELEQALHLHQLLDFYRTLEDFISFHGLKPALNYYKNLHFFQEKIMQRQLPQTEGSWYGIYPEISN